MKSILLCFTAILLCIGFYRCEKKVGQQPLPQKFVPIPKEIKDWAYFKPGSYWIMRDSTTGYLDSTYVESVATKTVYAGIQNDTIQNHEQITVRFKSSYIINDFYKIQPDIGCEVTSNYADSGPYRKLALDSSRHFCAADILKGYRVFTSLNLNGITFSNVIYNQVLISFKAGSQKEQSYWSKHIGIIKVPPYELLRYKVFQ